MLLSWFIAISTLLASQASHAYTIDEFLDTLDKNRVTTIDQAVSYLPASLRSRFTLMYQGHGLRETSYQEPAAILFEKDGSFFVNIGSPAKAMGDQIEIIQFNKQQQVLQLFSVKFPLKRNSAGRIIRPQENPAECMTCHGSGRENKFPHLIWSRYSSWPGAYGSHHDTLRTKASFTPAQLTNPDNLKDLLESTELIKFKKTAKQKLVYRHLLFDTQTSNQYWPYWYADDMTTMDKMRNDGDYFGLNIRPNMYFGFIAARVTAHTMLGELKRNPNFKKNRYALSRQFTCGEKLDFGKKLNSIIFDFNEDSGGAEPILPNDGFSSSFSYMKNLIAYELAQNDSNLKSIISFTGLGKKYYKNPELFPEVVALDRLLPIFKLQENTDGPYCEYIKEMDERTRAN